MNGKGLPAWLTPDSAWKGFQSNRFQAFSDRAGRPYAEDFYTYSTNVAASIAPGATQVLNFQIESDASFLWEATVFAQIAANAVQGPANAQMTLQIVDAGPHRRVFNVPTPVSNICGVGGLPHLLPVPKLFPANQAIAVALINYDSAITYTSVQVSFLGRKIFNSQRGALGGPPRFNAWRGQDGKTYWDDYYAYTLSLATIASLASNVAVPPLLLDGDSDFEWITASACSSPRGATTGATTLLNAVQVQIQDGGSQRNLLSAPAFMGNIFGNGPLPFINPQTRIFEGATQINMTLNNTDTADAVNNLFFTFEGRKIYCED